MKPNCLGNFAQAKMSNDTRQDPSAPYREGPSRYHVGGDRGKWLGKWIIKREGQGWPTLRAGDGSVVANGSDIALRIGENCF